MCCLNICFSICPTCSMLPFVVLWISYIFNYSISSFVSLLHMYTYIYTHPCMYTYIYMITIYSISLNSEKPNLNEYLYNFLCNVRY